jgi:hypothetical protein
LGDTDQACTETFWNITANRAVVLSAGVVGSPRILLYSGIGPSDVLSPVGIETLYELPSVGKNITEQPGCRLEFRVNSTDTEDTVIRNDTLDAQLLEQWNETRTGFLSMGPLNPIAWLRLPDDAPVEDPSTGPNTPHYELFAWVCRVFMFTIEQYFDNSNSMGFPISPRSQLRVTS